MAKYKARGPIPSSAFKPALKRLAEAILEDAKTNIVDMGAVDTGHLHESGTIEPHDDGYAVGFTADYAAIVHEGEGTSKGIGPRPFLAQAAFKDRGKIE